MLLNCGPVLFPGLNELNSPPCVNSQVSANFNLTACEHWTLIPGCVPVNLKDDARKNIVGRTPHGKHTTGAKSLICPNEQWQGCCGTCSPSPPTPWARWVCTDPTPAFTCSGIPQHRSCWKPCEDEPNSVPYRVLIKINGLWNAQLRIAPKYCLSGSYFRGKRRS